MIISRTRRYLSFFLSLCTLLTLFSCAKKEKNASFILSDVMKSCESVPAYFLYSSDISENRLDEKSSYLLFRDRDLPSYCESYAVALSEDDLLWELHIFVGRSLGDAGLIENAMYKRLDLLQRREVYIYDTETYEEHISSGKVIRNGKIVCLTLCDDNIKIAKAIKDL
ncbi:MAG: hypothetical protein IJZ03_04240 [Clostridia bacterium]|nr:hypothetical protein [Clostridia bacterium]